MRKLILFIVIFASSLTLNANDKSFSVADFGLKPNTRENAVPFLQKAIEACRATDGAVLYFPEGRYDFWPQHAIEVEYFESNTYDNNPKTLAILLEHIKDLTIDGNNSQFVMHGRIQPFTLDNCENITLKNFSIDWEIPLTAEGVVTSKTADYIDIEIDTRQFPYVIEKNRLNFVGEGWKSEMFNIIQFDPDTRLVRYNSGDFGWGGYHVEEVKYGTVRLSDPKRELNDKFPPIGTLLVLRHNSRDHAGIFVYHSDNTKMKNIKVHHTGGLGILSQYSKNIEMDDVHVIPNAAKNRVLSGHDDGFHFMGCSGLIKIENCSWAGLMDDPVNIHGTCARITEILSPTRIKCKFMHDMSEGMEWGRSGELVGFIENKTMHTIGTGEMTGFEELNKSEFIVELSKPIPTSVKAGHALENLTCTPDVEIRNSRFGSCRARGLLLSTPGKVIVENNIFESSGSAILIAGDANQWYESGAVKDVIIRGNEFRYPCNSSIYQFCEAVISIFPEIPESDVRYPFHSNIRIENNTFHLFDYPILYAHSVNGLTFSNNTLIRNTVYQPFHPRKDGITLEACKAVEIVNNRVEGDMLGKTIRLNKTKQSDVKLKGSKFFIFVK